MWVGVLCTSDLLFIHSLIRRFDIEAFVHNPELKPIVSPELGETATRTPISFFDGQKKTSPAIKSSKTVNCTRKYINCAMRSLLEEPKI